MVKQGLTLLPLESKVRITKVVQVEYAGGCR